jgi:tRNA-dihydrouridine synthase
MIGRAAIGAPWFFQQVKHFIATGESMPLPGMAERVKAVRTHLRHSLEWKGDRLGVVEMRRHYANYFRGLPHFKEHRLALVTLENPVDLEAKLDEIAEVFAGHDFGQPV